MRNPFYPITMFNNLWNYRDIIILFIKREVIDRYKGSYLGLFWSILHPILMLVVYTFVFNVIFKTNWGNEAESKSEFALILFCGLIAYNIFADCVSRSPDLIVKNINSVKKNIPLEIFTVVTVGSSLIHGLISLTVLTIGLIFLKGVIHWTLIFLPIVLLPIILILLGLGWFLSALGVFLRDLDYISNVVVRAVLFLSPIFYPISAVPEKFTGYFYLNPLTYVIEDVRRVLIWGRFPDWNWLANGTLGGVIVALLGYVFFYKVKKWFDRV